MSNIVCPICKKSDQITLAPSKKCLPNSAGALRKLATENCTKLEFQLAVCLSCSHGFNAIAEFQGKVDYADQQYLVKNSVGGKMSEQIRAVAKVISSNMNLVPRGIKVLEIGAGSGELSHLLSLHHGCRVTTVDPSIGGFENPRIKHYQKYFDNEFVCSVSDRFDIIIMRHVIEHVNDPIEMIKLAVELLNNNGLIYIEVPNFNEIVDSMRFIDLFNDHIQYFTHQSLYKSLRKANLYSMADTAFFSGSHIGTLCRKGHAPTGGAMPFRECSYKFTAAAVMDSLNASSKEVIDQINYHNNICIYGAGAQGNTLMHWLPIEIKQRIFAVVDLDIKKHGRFLHGCNISIKMPDKHITSRSDLIVNTSVLYKDEIEYFLRNELMFKKTLLHIR
jgi:2-polyprenyl-3-methyl-5-hydroxy-6-metoxy-1,4-benzoquinol methylase